MKLIIDLPEEVLNSIKTFKGKFICEDGYDLIQGIKDGIPLLKSSGRLIILSEDAVKREQTYLGFSCQSWIGDVGLSNATVAIIEADKED